ncbi:hypothetical protein DFQ27_009959 [Actinomortierella ambigua]|uniref:J domain-containing protein n=1 Tax=Actinomortierella ambigua TaxID=1343610 RepID=A0A9P6QI97_9FUNG|nr:hypothetical protein DFQ27_009959 [Actinomortierella ambigua]
MDPYENTSLPEDVPDSRSDSLDVDSLDPPTTDYYAVLNIPKTASDESIRDSYKRLSRIFHPDKHSDPALKEAAETKFHIINKAFEVLSDPQTRAIYDTFGEEGLKTKWEVGQKLKTPEELRAEYARLAREQREQELESLVRSRNDITMQLDMSRVFNNREAPSPFAGTHFGKKQKTSVLDALARTEVVQLYMKNSFETQLSTGTQLIVGGQMSSRSGMGGGNIVGTLRHTFNQNLQIEMGSSLLRPRVGVLKGTYSIDPMTFVTGTAQVRHFGGPPPLVMTFGRRITKGATGYMTYRTGEWALGSWGPAFEYRRDFSSMALGVSGDSEGQSYQAEMQMGIMQSHLSLDRTWTLADDSATRIRLGGNLSTTGGINAHLGADRKVTEHTKVGLSVEVGLAGGVSVSVKVKRLGQSVTVPIVLSHDFHPKLAFWAVVAPACAATALELGYIRPKRRRERAEKVTELRRVHADFIANQRKEAEEAIALLRDSTARKTKTEQDKDGLVIIEAIYGNLDADVALCLITDVTIPVQALVHNSQLSMPGGHSKTHIMGFHDPCLGEKKKLKIRYMFKRRLHEVIVADTASVIAPIRSHLLP